MPIPGSFGMREFKAFRFKGLPYCKSVSGNPYPGANQFNVDTLQKYNFVEPLNDFFRYLMLIIFAALGKISIAIAGTYKVPADV